MGAYTSVPLDQDFHQQAQQQQPDDMPRPSQDMTGQHEAHVPQDRLGDVMSANCVGGVPDEWLEYHRTVQKFEPTRRMSQLPVGGYSPWLLYCRRKDAEAARPPAKKLPPLRKPPCLRDEPEDDSWQDFVPAPEDSDDEEDATPESKNLPSYLAPKWGTRTRGFFSDKDISPFRPPPCLPRSRSPMRIYAGFSKEEIEDFDRGFEEMLKAQATARQQCSQS